MNAGVSSFGSIVTINVQFLLAFGLGWVAWTVWPQDVKWWGLGLVSIAFGFASLIQSIQTLKLMIRVYQRDKTLRDFAAQGAAPKSAEMASAADLDRAGMR